MGDSTSSTSYCSHCERQVPAANFDLHVVHCKRNLERCNICGEMVAKSRALEHFDDVHAPVKCTLCDETIERELYILHQNDKCPQRMMACGFCDFPVAAIDLDAHADHCGNRTEMCLPCGKYVRLKEKAMHDIELHSDSTGEGDSSSRNHATYSRPVNSDPAPAAQNRGAATSKQRLFVTFAITGIAIIIGTFVLQRREPVQRQH